MGSIVGQCLPSAPAMAQLLDVTWQVFKFTKPLDSPSLAWLEEKFGSEV